MNTVRSCARIRSRHVPAGDGRRVQSAHRRRCAAPPPGNLHCHFSKRRAAHFASNWRTDWRKADRSTQSSFHVSLEPPACWLRSALLGAAGHSSDGGRGDGLKRRHLAETPPTTSAAAAQVIRRPLMVPSLWVVLSLLGTPVGGAYSGGYTSDAGPARQTSGQLTTRLVFVTVTWPAAAALWIAAYDVSRRGVLPNFQVTLLIAQSGG